MLKLEPYCQQQNVARGVLVVGNIWFMGDSVQYHSVVVLCNSQLSCVFVLSLYQRGALYLDLYLCDEYLLGV